MRQKLQKISSDLTQGFGQSQKKARGILLGLLAVLLVLTGARWGVSAYQSYAQGLQQEIEIKENRYSNLARFMAEAERYQQEHQALLQFQEDFLAQRMIQASTSSLAEAKLQDLVNELAEDSGLNVRSMRTPSREQARGITMLRVQVSSRGEISSIKDFLQGISGHEKFIFVEEMEVGIINRREERFFNFNAQLVAWTRL